MKPQELSVLIDPILTNWAKSDPKVVSVIQFGSTCKSPIKRQTDIDLLVIANYQPSERKQFRSELMKLDKKIDQAVSILDSYQLACNAISRSLESLSMMSPLFLDFPECHRLVFDPQGVGADLIAKVIAWRSARGARRIEKGQLWYWIYDNGPADEPVDFNFLK